MIMLEGVDVCPIAWYTIMGVSRVTYYQWKVNANNGLRAEHHGNAGTVKPRSHTLQATATLRLMLEQTVDHMPHRTTTIETGEKVVSKCLPSSWRWKDSLPEINIVKAQFGLNKVSPSGLSRIRNEPFPKTSPKSQGDSFARCGQCDKFKKLRAACIRGSRTTDLWTRKLGAHIDAQTSHRELYYANRSLSKKEPTKVLTIIHDKMDHSKTASPHFSHKNKAIDSLMKLLVAVTGMIAHGHGDVGMHTTVWIFTRVIQITLLDLMQSYCGTWKVLRCILLSSYSLEVARLPCFKHCSLGLICARVPFILQQQIPLWRLLFLQF
jgi:hypothetical protein